MKNYYTVKELGEAGWFAFKSEVTIRKMIQSGQLEVKRISQRKMYITAESAARFKMPDNLKHKT